MQRCYTTRQRRVLQPRADLEQLRPLEVGADNQTDPLDTHSKTTINEMTFALLIIAALLMFSVIMIPAFVAGAMVYRWGQKSK